MNKNISEHIELAAIEKAEVINPEFAGMFGHYAMYVPEYSKIIREVNGKEYEYLMSKRAADEIAALVFDSGGNMLSERVIKNYVGVFIIRIRAKLAQLIANPDWLNALECHEEREDLRLKEENIKATFEGEPKNLTRLMRRRFAADVISNSQVGKQTFETAPRTKTKMTEEMLVHPTERLIYERREDGNENCDLEHLIIDPAYISDTLLRNLGLEKFVPPKRLNKTDKIAFRAGAIEEIKVKLGSLNAINLTHDSPREKHYLRTFVSEDGYILGTTNTIRGKQLFRANLVDAVNRFGHIDESYKDEIGKLRRINNTINGIDFWVSNEWQKVKNVEELAKIKNEFVEIVESLKWVNNKLKKEMLALLVDCLTLESTYIRKIKEKGKVVRTETTVRLNPGAKRAKWNVVPGKITERINEIIAIDKYLGEDKIRLEVMKADHELIPFEGLYNYIEEKSKEKGKGIEPIVGMEEKKELLDKLTNWKREFDSALKGKMMEPYRSFAKKVYIKIHNAESLLATESLRRGDVVQAIIKIYLVSKLQVFWARLQGIYEKFLNGQEIPYFLQLNEEIVELKKMLRNKRVGAGMDSQEFDQAYYSFYGLLDEMINKSLEGKDAMKNGDKDLAWKIKGEMYRLVANVKIVEVVGKIG